MKSFRKLVQEVQMVDTPFERKVRDVHQVQVWDLPPEMSGDDVIAAMPKDTSRYADQNNPVGIMSCTTCGTDFCPECGGATCDCECNEAMACTCSKGKKKMVTEETANVVDIAEVVDDISAIWEQLAEFDLDQESLGVVFSDLNEIRKYLKNSIPPTTADVEPRITDPAVDVDSVAALPDPVPFKTAKSGDNNVYKPVPTRYGSIYEAYSPGNYKLDDGTEVKLSADDAHLLNTLYNRLKPENTKKMKSKTKGNFVGFSNIMQFAKTALEGDKK